MPIGRFVIAGTCCFALSMIAPARAQAPRDIYVLEDAGKVLIFRRHGTSQISGRDTQMNATVSIARQALGDLVIANRAPEEDKSGSIVTPPPGEGNLAAKSVIKCRNFTPWGIALDGDSNIWMTDYESNDVRAYPATANGCPKPLVRISGPHTGLNLPEAVAVDSHGRIVVANYLDAILVFAPGANGDATPIARISGSKTQIQHIEGLALDAKNNIWVTCYAARKILEFEAGASGDAAPERVISGANTKLDAPVGIAIDRRTGEIYVADYGTRAMLVFSKDARGNAVPIGQFDQGGFPFGVALH